MSSGATYQRIPDHDTPDSISPPHPDDAENDDVPQDREAPLRGRQDFEPEHELDPSHRPLRASVQAEFNRPPAATWKKVLLVLTIIGLGWLSVKLGKMGTSKQPQIIYAQRYSDEYKYRPAASPVITEYLKDGRIRLRGASIGGVGVREEDIPLTPFQKAAEDKKRVEEARRLARERMGLKTKKKKARKIKTTKDEDDL